MLITYSFPFYRQISSSLYSVVHCLSLRWFRVSYLHRSPARESRMSLCVQAAANCATITGNSSPEVMMIMDFAANDFGWAALLASSAESAAIFMNKKYFFFFRLFFFWLDQRWTAYWTWCWQRSDEGLEFSEMKMTNSFNNIRDSVYIRKVFLHSEICLIFLFFFCNLCIYGLYMSYKHVNSSKIQVNCNHFTFTIESNSSKRVKRQFCPEWTELVCNKRLLRIRIDPGWIAKTRPK